MALKNQPTMLNGINPLSYLGVNPYTPSASYTQPRAPTPADNDGFQIFDLWMNTSTNDVWYLAKKSVNGAKYALWLMFNNGADLETLTGDVGGPVGPDGARNINTLGTVGQILVTGNPGTNTLTWSLDGSIARQYTEDVGVAIPVAGNLNIFGIGGITTSGAGDTVTIDTDGTIATEYVENTGSAIPALGILNVLGNLGISTTGSGNTIEIDVDGQVALSYPTDAGTAIPALNVLNVFGGTAGRDINTTGAGNTIHVELNNAITLGDLSVLAAGVNALTITTGDINMPAGQNSATTNQRIKMAGGTISFFLNNTFVGQSCGNTTMTPGVALFNAGIGPSCLSALTTGNSNTAMGNGAGQLIQDGTNNCYFGNVAGQFNVSGIENCGFGDGALNSATSSFNCGFGDGALQHVVTGQYNAALGNQAGGTITTSDSSNIFLNNPGSVGDNNTLRIGAGAGTGTQQLNKAFIHGIRGITTGVNDAIAVLIDSAGQLGTVSSSARYKENIHDMADDSLSLYNLRPVTFNYKGMPESDKRFGLIAEEVAEQFPYLVALNAEGEPESVKYHEIAAILLNEVQRLHKRILVLEAQRG